MGLILAFLIALALFGAAIAVVLVILRRSRDPSMLNPPGNLVPCPDCGRPISQLAKQCPQCGRPLAG